jgi:hypothetical protein
MSHPTYICHSFEVLIFWEGASETGSHFVTQAGLELAVFLPLCLPSVGVIGMDHYAQLKLIFLCDVT